MNRSLIITIGASLLLSSTVSAKPLISITFDSKNPAIDTFTKGPVARTWSWTCKGTDITPPLKLRCQVYDVTTGVGTATLLSDKDCGTFNSTQATVTHTYDVASPKADHRYMYTAYCTDSASCGGNGGEVFWYDVTPPVSKIHSGPPKVSNSADVKFVVSCTDNSFLLTTPPLATPSGCANNFRLVNTDTNVVVKPWSYGVSTTNGAKLNVNYGKLPPGNYRFETYAEDHAGNLGVKEVWTWGISGPDMGVPDAAPQPDSAVATPDSAVATPDTGAGKQDTGAGKLDTGAGKDAGDTYEAGSGNKDGGGKTEAVSGTGDSGDKLEAGSGTGDSGDKLEAGSGNKDAGDTYEAGSAKNDGGGAKLDQGKSGGDGADSGCDCRAFGSGAPQNAGLLVILLGLGLALRRRR